MYEITAIQVSSRPPSLDVITSYYFGEGGYIVVPGNPQLGTTDFCVMKYEASSVLAAYPFSAPGMQPAVSVTQSQALQYSRNMCDQCHLLTNAEWLTIAYNVMSVPSNWTGGSVGEGSIYSGHNDSSPAQALATSADDSDGYFGTGNSTSSGANQRRTLTLTNGEVIWDLAGNVYEWTADTIGSGQQPGPASESAYAWKQWNNSSIQWNGLPWNSEPSALWPSVSWSNAQGIGSLYSNRADGSVRPFARGGAQNSGTNAGVLGLYFGYTTSSTSANVGYRVARPVEDPPGGGPGSGFETLTWVQAIGAPQRGWGAAAANTNGSVMVLGAGGTAGYLYTSTNGGNTWTERTSAGSSTWGSIATSSDGTRMVAAGGSYIYTSTNSGASWVRSGAGGASWLSVDSASDGQRLAATAFANDSSVRVSTNGGTSWLARNPDPDGYIYACLGIASAADGLRLATTCFGEPDFLSHVYTSTNAGSSWTDRFTTTSDYAPIASSDDGMKLVVADYGGPIRTSTDGGVTWVTRTSAGNRNWNGVASSADGNRLVAAAYGGYIYTSVDAGVNWVEQTTPGARNWYTVAISGDGKKIIAGANENGYPWIGSFQ